MATKNQRIMLASCFRRVHKLKRGMVLYMVAAFVCFHFAAFMLMDFTCITFEKIDIFSLVYFLFNYKICFLLDEHVFFIET